MLFFLIISAIITAAACLSGVMIGDWTDLWKAAVLFVCSVLGLLVAFLLVCLVTGTALKNKGKMKKPNEFCRFLAESFCRIFIDLGAVRVHVTGEDKLPKDKRFLLVCNHRSGYDPMVCMTALRKYKISFISKPENMNIPFAGPILEQCGFLAIDRDNNRNAMRTINRAAEFITEDMLSVGIYPEGTRSREDTMLPFRSGAFKIAVKAKCPIVVTAIRGTDRIKKNMPFKRTDVFFDIIGVLGSEDIKGMRTHEISAIARDMMNAALGIVEEPVHGAESAAVEG